jgi:Undecaprenyl-phosphate galactose phosphotransferase WbaP
LAGRSGTAGFEGDPVDGRTETSESDTGVAVLRTAVAQGGLFHSNLRYALPIEMSQTDAGGEAVAQTHTFTRKVGAQYIFQSLLNGLPLVMVDLGVLTATIVACRLLFHQLNLDVGIDVSAFWIPIATGFLLLNFELGLYPGVRLSPVEELRRLIVSVTCMFIVWAIGVAVLRGGLAMQWVYLLVVYLACLLALPICRGWFRQVLGRWTRWGIPVLICGNDPATVRLYHWLTDHRQLGMRPVGVIADPDTIDIGPEDHWYAGDWPQTPQVAAERGVYWAVVLPPENKHAAISTLIADHLYTLPHVHVLSEITGLPDHWNPQQLDGLSGIHLQQNLTLPLPRVTKRCMDLAAAVVGSIILLPLLFYLAVAVKMSSRGPIVYAHERIGRNGRHFKAWKFRTMFQNADQVLELYLEDHPELREEWQRDHKLKFDPRVTKIGRFLRKTSLDELPQLWNVIRGDMSLVGPRPIVDAEIVKYGPYYGLYTMVKPGITGLWQVSGRNNTTYDERVQFDAYYVRNWSPWLDLYLLLRTIRIVLFAHGAY